MYPIAAQRSSLWYWCRSGARIRFGVKQDRYELLFGLQSACYRLGKVHVTIRSNADKSLCGGDWLFSHFIIARRNKETCRFILRPPCNDGFNSGYFLRTVCRCLVIVNGRAIYSCRSGLYINGSHANYHFIAVESSFSGENNISPSSWSCHQRVGCRFVLCISFIAIIHILQS